MQFCLCAAEKCGKKNISTSHESGSWHSGVFYIYTGSWSFSEPTNISFNWAVAAVLPSGHSPRASYVMSSLAEKQSCSSTTSTSLGLRPANSKHFLAANRDMSYPTWTEIRKYVQTPMWGDKCEVLVLSSGTWHWSSQPQRASLTFEIWFRLFPPNFRLHKAPNLIQKFTFQGVFSVKDAIFF